MKYIQGIMAGIAGASFLLGAYVVHKTSEDYKAEAESAMGRHIWYSCACEGKNQAHAEFKEYKGLEKKAKSIECLLAMFSGIMFTAVGSSLASEARQRKLEEKIRGQE